MDQWQRARQWLATAIGAQSGSADPVVVVRNGVTFSINASLGRGSDPGTGLVSIRPTVSTDLPTAATFLSAGTYRKAQARIVAGRPRIVLQSETERDGIGKALGLNREHQTGDEKFDAAVYVESEDPEEQLQAVLGEAATRQSVLTLMGMGCERLGINDDGGRLTATLWVDCDAEGAERMNALLDELVRLVGSLPSFADRATRRRFKWWRLPLLVPLASPWLGIPLAVAGGQLFPTVGNEPISWGIVGGLSVWLLTLPILWIAARGRPRGLAALAMTAVPSLVGYPILAVGGLHLANGWRDPHAVVEATTKIGSKNENDDSYYLVLEPTDDGLVGPLEVEVGRDLWQATSVGDAVVLPLHEGRLGWRWYGDVRR